MFDWVKSLAQVLDAVGKGWRLTLPGAVTAGVALYGPDSVLPYAATARNNYGAWLLLAFLFCTIHVAVFLVAVVGQEASVAARETLRGWSQFRKLRRLTDAQKRLLKPVLQQGMAQALLARIDDPDARRLQQAGIWALNGVNNRLGNEYGKGQFWVREWARNLLKQNPALLDVTDESSADIETASGA